MSARTGWTLVEMLVVIAIIVLLTVLVVPSIATARRRARLVACSMQMHNLHQAMIAHAVANRRCLPPFMFSSLTEPSLPLSGHWGGISRLDDPVLFGTRMSGTGEKNLPTVNFWVLAAEGGIGLNSLICPAADLGDGSYFPYSTKFSTYCLRFPYSQDIFRGWPNPPAGVRLLDFYLARPGGDFEREVNDSQRVPLIRLDWRYRTAGEAACTEGNWGDNEYEVAGDAMFSDAFWQQQYEEPGGDTTLPVRRGWCHDGQFNVMYGGGAVRTVDDDGMIAANSWIPGAPPDRAYDASRAERCWQYFDRARQKE